MPRRKGSKDLKPRKKRTTEEYIPSSITIRKSTRVKITYSKTEYEKKVEKKLTWDNYLLEITQCDKVN
jgi:hypothetical protein